MARGKRSNDNKPLNKHDVIFAQGNNRKNFAYNMNKVEKTNGFDDAAPSYGRYLRKQNNKTDRNAAPLYDSVKHGNEPVFTRKGDPNGYMPDPIASRRRVKGI